MKLVLTKKELNAMIKEEVKKTIKEMAAVPPPAPVGPPSEGEKALVAALQGGTPVFNEPEIQAALADPATPVGRKKILQQLLADKSVATAQRYLAMMKQAM